MEGESSSSAAKKSWSRKRKQLSKVALMNVAKRKPPEEDTSTQLSESTTETSEPARETSEPTRETSEPTRMDQGRMISENSDNDSSDSEEDEEFSGERAQEIFDEWILSLRLDQRRMLSVILMESFKNRQNMNTKDAAQESGSIVGFNEKTVRKYRNDFFNNKGSLSEFRQGKYERHCVYHNEDVNKKAREWVRENGFKKGEPNMTAASFCEYVNSTLLPSSHLPPFFPRTVSLRTAIRWLHHLGFKPRSHKKGVYIDGHES